MNYHFIKNSVINAKTYVYISLYATKCSKYLLNYPLNQFSLALYALHVLTRQNQNYAPQSLTDLAIGKRLVSKWH